MQRIEFSSQRDLEKWRRSQEEGRRRRLARARPSRRRLEEAVLKPVAGVKRSGLGDSPPEGRKSRQTKGNGQKRGYIPFVRTPAGHFLYVYAPIQYYMYLSYASAMGRGKGRRMARLKLMEDLAEQSGSAVFSAERWRLALVSYHLYGQTPADEVWWDLDDALYFARHSYHVHRILRELAG